MKRLFTVFSVITLLFSTTFAHAENVLEQINAPKTYQADYYTNTKKTHVEVDAQLFVPDVDTIAMYSVSAKEFTAQEAWDLASAVLPDQTWHLEEEYSKLSEGALYHYENPEFNYMSDSLNLYSDDVLLADGNKSVGSILLINSFFQTVFGLQADDRTLRFQAKDGYNHPYYYFTMPFMVENSIGKDIKGQSTHFEEAKAQAEALVAQLNPHFAFQIGGAVSGEICYHKEGSKQYRNVEYKTPAYLFAFSRVIDGITITFEQTHLLVSELQSMPVSSAPDTERITVVVHDGRIVTYNYESPYTVGEILEESCTLLPFEQIMHTFEQIAPLSIQNMENENLLSGGKSNYLKVTEIRLGYMPVLKKDSSNQWVLRPVWDFIGIRRFAKENIHTPCQSWLTIDAIDGTVIDRNYGY